MALRARRAGAVAANAGSAFGSRRDAWLAATLALTLFPCVLVVVLAPPAGRNPVPALVLLLFVGSSMHVAATGWFLTVGQVREHMWAQPMRYVWTPCVLVVGLAVLSVGLPTRALIWVVLGFFAWQFQHFQKQNLGVAALGARSCGARGLSLVERRALVAAGVGGIAALVGHPDLLQVVGVHRQPWLFTTGAVVFAVAVIVGVVSVARRPTIDRPARFAIVYLVSLLFFVPVFCFASPYAAVAGLTIAHGLQYLLLVGLLASAPSDDNPAGVGLLVLLTIALAAGVALNWASHQHGGGPLERAAFGAYLGVVSAHFVIDAGLWRLRDEFPRRFLTQRLPYLLTPKSTTSPNQAADLSRSPQ